MPYFEQARMKRTNEWVPDKVMMERLDGCTSSSKNTGTVGAGHSFFFPGFIVHIYDMQRIMVIGGCAYF